MESQTIQEKTQRIDDAVKDAADYLCSRGDTEHLRPEIEERVRRVLYGLSLKGWHLDKQEQTK